MNTNDTRSVDPKCTCGIDAPEPRYHAGDCPITKAWVKSMRESVEGSPKTLVERLSYWSMECFGVQDADALMKEAADEIERLQNERTDLLKRVEFAADALKVVERRRDELKARLSHETAPPPQTSNERFSDLRSLCEFAYEQGYHELGYDPVTELERELTQLREANVGLAAESQRLQNDSTGYWRDRCNRSEQAWTDAAEQVDKQATELERLQRFLRQKSEQISRLQEGVQKRQSNTDETPPRQPASNSDNDPAAHIHLARLRSSQYNGDAMALRGWAAAEIERLQRERDEWRKVAHAARDFMQPTETLAPSSNQMLQIVRCTSDKHELTVLKDACPFCEIERLHTQKNNLLNTVATKQAKIDALMLEFCPGEMSAEQRAEWAKHQRRSAETVSPSSNSLFDELLEIAKEVRSLDCFVTGESCPESGCECLAARANKAAAQAAVETEPPLSIEDLGPAKTALMRERSTTRIPGVGELE